MTRQCGLILLLIASGLAISLPADERESGQVRRVSRLKQPIREWFQPQHFDAGDELYSQITLVTSLDDARLAEKITRRGVQALKWCYGTNSEWSEGLADYDRRQCAPFLDGQPFRFAGVGIDEWNPGDPRYPTEKDLAAHGFRAARAEWPDSIMIGWVTQPDATFIELLRDGTLDLAIIEGYTFIPDVGGLTLAGICEHCDIFKKANLLDRTIVCFGYLSATPDQRGRRMTIEELERPVRHIQRQYPEMPGVAFYGFKDDTPETRDLIRRADALSGRLYPSKAPM